MSIDFQAKLAALRAAQNPTPQVAPTPAPTPQSAPVQSTGNAQYDAIKQNIAAISQALLSNNPALPVLLTTIKRTLKNDPQLVTLLSEEDICAIVQGLDRQTGNYLANAMVKSKTSETKKLKNATAADLGF